MNNAGNETNGSTWVLGANYALFENIVANGSGVITMTSHSDNSIPNDVRIGLNGFQLVSVPEPSTALLAGFGLLGLVRRRRA